MSHEKDVEIDPSIKAFSEVWAKVGQQFEPKWDKITDHVVRNIGGWEHICNAWTAKDRQWHSTEFIREYERVDKLIKAGNDPQKKAHWTGNNGNTLSTKGTLSALERVQNEIYDTASKRKSNNETMRKFNLNNIIKS